MKKVFFILFIIIFILFSFGYRDFYNKKNQIKKDFNVLNTCKLTYPDSKTIVANYWKLKNYKSDFFYVDNWNIVFVLDKKELDWKIRNELRQWINWKNLWWDISDNKIHYLLADVKLSKIRDLDEYTFLQIHSEVNPLLRIIVKKNKNWIWNHIWAVVRINTNKTWKRTERYDLWEVNNKFEKIEVLAGDNKLIVKKNNKIYVNKNVSYWPEKQNYFKAWIYDSKNSKWPWQVKIFFRDLYMN